VGGVPHLILVGLPGAGKTTVGAALAERLGWPFLDLDARIEERAGMRVAQIFEALGESAFRGMERAATMELAESTSRFVVAPGGGWITVPGLVELVRPPSRLVFLQVAPTTAIQRLEASVANRPLLAGPDPLAALHRLLTARQAFYLQADHTLSVDLMTPDEVAAAIMTLAGH